MKEAEIRKWHGRMGALLAVFIILQAGSGLFISIKHLRWFHGHDYSLEQHMREHSMQPEDYHAAAVQDYTPYPAEQRSITEIMGSLHHGGGYWGTIYRILLAAGLLGQAMGGSFIFFKTRQRSKRVR